MKNLLFSISSNPPRIGISYLLEILINSRVLLPSGIFSAKLFIEKLKIYPDVANKQVQLVANIKNTSEKKIDAQLALQAALVQDDKQELNSVKQSFSIKDDQEITITYPMGEDVKLWDEFSPDHYQMTVSLQSDLGIDTEKVNFGMR